MAVTSLGYPPDRRAASFSLYQLGQNAAAVVVLAVGTEDAGSCPWPCSSTN